MIVKTCTRLLLLLALLTVSLATTVARAQGGAEWEPDPASAEALLGPRRSFGEFSVRIPNAFVFAGPRWATNASETSYSWTAGLQAGNEQTPFYGLIITLLRQAVPEPRPSVKDSLDAAATSFLKNTLRTWGTPRATAIQHGTLHGKPFVRCVWTATSPNGGETAGTLYLTVFEQQSRRQFVSFVTAMPMKDNDATRRILLPANQSVLSFLPVEGPVNVTASPLGDGRILEPGVRLREVTLQRDDTAAKERLWIYLPDPLPATPIPCIFLAPAGTRPFNGVTLGDNDRPEHLPYVHAGYAVVAYDTDGEWGGSRVPDDQFVNILGQFRQARAGLVNAHAAIDYSLAQLPQIDPKRLYVAGHGSAGSLALLAAEYEPRIAGCLAYAPCTDIFAQVDADHRAKLDHALPGEEDFLAWCSPITAVDRLKCPVFLFQADDDSLYPIARTEQFVQKLQDTNKDVTFTRARKGGHYSAMISQGIPAGIQWLKKQSKPSDAAPNVASAR